MIFAILPLLLAQPSDPPAAGVTADEPPPAVAPAEPIPKPLFTELTVTPAPAPRPALKIELLPRLRTNTTEDAAVAYLRAFLLMNHLWSKETEQTVEQINTWLRATRPADLPLDQMKTYLEPYATTLKELDRAARCDRCTWGSMDRVRENPLSAELPEIFPPRNAARILAVRCRVELAEGRYDDAAKTLHAGFQLARRTGDAPLLLPLLVGLGIEGIFLQRVEDWVATPGSPNLYWALAALPNPLIDPRPAIAGEGMFAEMLMPTLARVRAEVLPHDEAGQLLQDLMNDLGKMPGLSRDLRKGNFVETTPRLLSTAYVVWHYASARRELIERGTPAAEVDRMAGTQVVLLNSYERYLELRDDQWKWFGQPYHLAYPALKEVNARSQKAIAENHYDMPFIALSMILPASEKVIAAVARSERRVAALRAVEAVRMYAAGHDGRVPPTLADCPVPVPADPFTGQPFEYTAAGETFTLRGPPIGGEPPTHHNTIEYRVTVTAAPK